MHGSFNILWSVMAGIAIFLLGMNFLEEALRQLAGRPFKLFLKKQTARKGKAVTGGFIVTGLLQSSSIVNLMVLAFVGAGVIRMQQALAVTLGANLGSTVNSWIVATVGFRVTTEGFALPVTGLAGLLMILSAKESVLRQWSKLLFGFGFLFVGLEYLKNGMDDFVKKVDLAALSHYPLIVFLLAGLVITALIQSSAATVAIMLSALDARAVPLIVAAAVVLGSETGTSLKLLLASLRGIAAKKRVAWGNILFNLVTTIVVFIFLGPLVRFITGGLGIGDNLFALVFFQSLVNVIGILLFYPFLGRFGRFLENRFVAGEKETTFIHTVKVTDTDLALAALEKETRSFLDHVAFFSLLAFDKHPGGMEGISLHKEFESKPWLEKYEYIKHLYGEIHAYCLGLQHGTADRESSIRLEQLVASLRNGMYAAKSLKDAWNDVLQLRNSSNDIKYNFYIQAKKRILGFYRRLLKLPDQPEPCFKELTEMYTSVREGYIRELQELYKEQMTRHLNEVEISTLFNFNREMYTSLKSFLFAMKDYLLQAGQAEYFDGLPGFIR